jgi:hypothetical protein
MKTELEILQAVANGRMSPEAGLHALNTPRPDSGKAVAYWNGHGVVEAISTTLFDDYFERPVNLYLQTTNGAVIPERLRELASEEMADAAAGAQEGGGYHPPEWAKLVMSLPSTTTDQAPQGSDVVYWHFEGSDEDNLDTLHNDVQVVISAGTLKGLLDGQTVLKPGESLQSIANKVCAHTPEGWVIRLGIEHGAAWVEAENQDGNPVELPDSADKALTEQLNDALCVANGWEQGNEKAGNYEQ